MIQSEIICDLLFVVPDHITLSPYIPTVQEIDYVNKYNSNTTRNAVQFAQRRSDSN